METNGNDRDGPGSNYTKVSNDILESLAKVGPYPMRIYFAVMRMTIGYQKPNGREISNKTFIRMTGIRRENIRRAIDDAILSKLVIRRDDKKGTIYRINKKTEEYNLSSSRMTQKCHPTG